MLVFIRKLIFVGKFFSACLIYLSGKSFIGCFPMGGDLGSGFELICFYFFLFVLVVLQLRKERPHLPRVP